MYVLFSHGTQHTPTSFPFWQQHYRHQQRLRVVADDRGFAVDHKNGNAFSFCFVFNEQKLFF